MGSPASVLPESRTDFLGDVEVSLPFGSLVVTDIIGKSVGEDSLSYSRIQGQRICRHLSFGRDGQSGDPYQYEKESGKDFSHYLKNTYDEYYFMYSTWRLKPDFSTHSE